MDNDDDNDIEGMSYNLLLCYHNYFYYYSHREITISGGVSKFKSDNTTPSLARSFKRRSLFGAQSGCNR